mmetsp:Transcript_15661/g.30391  ORF Transcript_15661/g.30391 Transcript_15661/m.30391 type:complete len:87 (+) Transcript_15661:1879-2139(+)
MLQLARRASMVHNRLSVARWSPDSLHYQWDGAPGTGRYSIHLPTAMAASQLAGGYQSRNLGQPLSIRQKPLKTASEHLAPAATTSF